MSEKKETKINRNGQACTENCEGNLFIKTGKDLDCRAIKEEFLDKLKGKYSPLVELVRNHQELALCFRGNSSPEEVTIYRNNHQMFKITSGRTLYFNPEHFRHCKEWETYLRVLFDEYEFNEIDKPFLNPVRVSVRWSKNKRTEIKEYSTKFREPKLSRTIDHEFLENKLETLYELISKVFDDAFNYDNEESETDYFLQWCFNHNRYVEDGNLTKEGLENYIKKKKKHSKSEKIRQQQIFSFMKRQKDGFFIYDMEFQQRHESKDSQHEDKIAGISNKPDMLAIRFDHDGKPVALVFVEVKSTYEACNGKSGVRKHIESMNKYPGERLPSRRREAYLIMHQYQELKLIELETPIDCNEYKDLPLEEILIFTDGAIDWLKKEGKDLVINGKHIELKGEEIPISKNENGVLVRL